MERCKVRMLRHEVTTGLMNAKQTGGRNAKGDVVAFFDCHVSPKPGWADEIFAKIRANPRRMVVPAITDLDLDTFDEKVNSAVNAKCYLTWDADFKWFDDESDYIPTISGGLVAMSRWWFNATGGFDDVMRGWGGENLDQSLRSWLCGGEIMRAKTSRIAHMWRTGDSRTRAHYHGRGGHVDNRARVVAAWYDVFAEKYQGRKIQQDEVKNYDPVKESLGCKPFAFFLWRFRHVYIDAGVIPERVFHIREKTSGLCLSFGWGGLALEGCDESKKKQVVQLGNQDQEEKGGKCCSGIRMFGSNDCLDYVKDGVPHTYSCDVTGRNTNQHYRWRPDGTIEKGLGPSKTCFGKPMAGLLSKKVAVGSCDPAAAGQYEMWGDKVPHERELYESEVRRLGYDKLDMPDN
ncbi:unnamed protein product [Prorocentrum cordatum]|uniref:Polypeptide N-acetylgalactosaminyltransferase n=1 Tax=Prorocentrum cordatum TaxID=2364126 RepID=A0ABN9Q6B9_9DINO|nr:unnamed protein product [Polarella glacialis]